MRKSPRQRRLEADYRSVEKLGKESSIFSFMASGDPPNRYRLQFEGPGICRDSRGKIQITHKHEVIVELGASYPRMVPNLLWQTPVFHPNISNNGVVCLGGYGTHWVPSLTLDEMSTMLWDMIRYENFDIQSPYNRDAALWARDQKKFKFPLDERDIRDLINSPKEKAAPFQTSTAPSVSSKSEKRGLGVFGAWANRILDRRERVEAAEEVAVPESVTAIEDVAPVEIISEDSEPDLSVDVETVSEHVSEASVAEIVEVIAPESDRDVVQEVDLVDPSDIEIIEDGITFLDVQDRSSPNVAPLSRSSSASPEAVVDEEDTGITFLD